MLLNTCSDSEVWNFEALNIPQRSILFNLEPLGLGTANVESLISYIMRLSDEHCLYPSDLMFRIVLPLFNNGEKVFKHKSFGNRIENFNGFGARAKELVNSLEILTLRRELKSLTLLPLSIIFSGATNEKIFHEHRTWCSLCLEEFRSSETTVHEKLIWSFRQVEICLEHQEILSQKCPHCDSKMAPLMGHSRAGYCSRCQQWLGAFKSSKIVEHTELKTDLAWQKYVVDNLGQLISRSTQAELPLTQTEIVSAISNCIEQISGGNKEAFYRLVGLPRKGLTQTLRHEVLPNFSRILHICYSLQVPVLDFLTGRFEDSALSLSEEQRKKMQIKSKTRRNSYKQVGKDSLQKLLESALEQEPPPMLESVIERSGYVKNTVLKYFPNLCSQIRYRYSQAKLTRIKSTLEAALEENPPPPLIEGKDSGQP